MSTKLFFYKGTNLVSKLVRMVTKSQYSHMGIMIDDIHVIDISINYGLKIRHLDYQKKKYDIIEVDLTREQVLEFSQIYFNTTYDWNEVFRMFFKKLKHNKKKVICSEFIYLMLSHYGILPESDDTFTPGDIYKLLSETV